jgi:hypothetical protein
MSLTQLSANPLITVCYGVSEPDKMPPASYKMFVECILRLLPRHSHADFGSSNLTKLDVKHFMDVLCVLSVPDNTPADAAGRPQQDGLRHYFTASSDFFSAGSTLASRSQIVGESAPASAVVVTKSPRFGVQWRPLRRQS